MPQAKREILMGRLYLKGEKYEDWVAQKRKEAAVSIYSDELS